MVIRGRIENGVVVFRQGVSLPEGMEVSVVVPADLTPIDAKMTDAQLRRYRDALARIDALPHENPADTFCGADHDQVLYGS